MSTILLASLSSFLSFLHTSLLLSSLLFSSLLLITPLSSSHPSLPLPFILFLTFAITPRPSFSPPPSFSTHFSLLTLPSDITPNPRAFLHSLTTHSLSFNPAPLLYLFSSGSLVLYSGFFSPCLRPLQPPFLFNSHSSTFFVHLHPFIVQLAHIAYNR